MLPAQATVKGNFGTLCPPSAIAAALLTWSVRTCFAQSDSAVQSELRQLKEQLRQQQTLIDELNRKVSDLQGKPAPAEELSPKPRSWLPDNFGKLHISGEGGVAFLDSGREGQFPHKEFTIDEAKLFFETPLWNDVYFFSEVNVVTREEGGDYLRIGELYLDFENLGRWFNHDRWLNLRVGRFDIPFGQEYLTRDAIDNLLSTLSFYGCTAWVIAV